MIDCSKCPSESSQGCCGIMIFSKEFIEKHKDKIEEGFIEIIEKGNAVNYLYPDCRCCFLDRKTRLCKIYESRPDVCKFYGTTDKLPCIYFKPSGNRRSPTSQKKMERQLDKDVERLNKKLGTDF